MELRLERRYINLPVKNGAPKRRMRFIVDGKAVREFEIELAEGDPDFWAFLDISTFTGRKAALEVDGLDESSGAFDLIHQDDIIEGSEDLYREKYRPQFHFSTRRGWSNDPNGLIYYKGEYHLFYQHNPYGCGWGDMHWGHAVSRDLVHWEELPIALYPHHFGDHCFSGSAVVDVGNTAGFKTGDEEVIVAAFTSTERGECIAYSNDRGRTFTDYEGNPVVKHRGRDPKLIWYEPAEHWIMAVYDEFDEGRYIAFYASSDLKNWEFRSRIEGYYECPEIFELPVDGDGDNKRWVVYAADGDYAIGSFDGRRFITESGKHRFSYGNCFYASQTWNNIPPEYGRRIQIAWGRVNMPGMPFNQMMLFPVELTLRTTEDGIRMFAEPVREVELLHGEGWVWRDKPLGEGENLLAGIEGDLFHIRSEFELKGADRIGFRIRSIPVTYDVRERRLECQGCEAPLKPLGDKIRLEILVDRTSIEIFANDGRIYMPIGVIPPDEDRSLEIFALGGEVLVRSMEIYEMRSAWRR
ncbi:GH32 C-terminal domain-containing protein [Candidatus Poribacteria bacterium]|nr:GH32 C-terminal domain-containing protein [Candidatus Poribacteria bacterium]